MNIVQNYATGTIVGLFVFILSRFSYYLLLRSLLRTRLALGALTQNICGLYTAWLCSSTRVKIFQESEKNVRGMLYCSLYPSNPTQLCSSTRVKVFREVKNVRGIL